MSLIELKTNLKKLLSDNRIPEAINKLIQELEPSSSLANKVLLQKRINSGLIENSQKGIVNYHDLQISQNKVADSLISIIDKISENDLFQEEASGEGLDHIDILENINDIKRIQKELSSTKYFHIERVKDLIENNQPSNILLSKNKLLVTKNIEVEFKNGFIIFNRTQEYRKKKKKSFWSKKSLSWEETLINRVKLNVITDLNIKRIKEGELKSYKDIDKGLFYLIIKGKNKSAVKEKSYELELDYSEDEIDYEDYSDSSNKLKILLSNENVIYNELVESLELIINLSKI